MLWLMSPSVSALEKWDVLASAIPPRFSVLNEAEFISADQALRAQYGDHEFWELPSLGFSRMPTIVLKVTDDSFTVDTFLYGQYVFASARLRRAFELPPTVIRYRPVDTSPSVPSVQASDYAMFDPTLFANPFDVNRTPGVRRPVRQPDGSLRTDWVLDREALARGLSGIYIKDDFEPSTPLFPAIGTEWILATKELAERITRAGIDDVLFQDITGPATPDRDRARPKP